MSDEASIAEDLAQRGVRTVLLTMVDQAGITRVKVLPVERVPVAVLRGIGFSLTSALLLCADDHIADDVEAYPQAQGDVRLFLDLEALRVIDPAIGLAWAPADQRTPDGETFPVCQRSVLRRQAASAAELGLDLRVAFELELTVFRGTPEAPELAHRGAGYGLLPVLQLESFVRDVLDRCRTAGLEVEQLHPEYGPGQLELSLRPAGPVEAVDRYLLARLVVSRAALAHGLMVSFAPVADVGTAANGCHLHLSAREEGRNVFADAESGQGMTPRGGQLVAGLVEHLWEGTAVLAPGVSSYDRLAPGHFSGAYLGWGVENREMALRFIPGVAGRRDAGANVEVKCADNAANPYLAVATVVACALEGVRSRLEPPDGVTVVPSTLDEEALRRHRVRRLPRDLGQALEALRGSDLLRAELGEDLVASYLAVRGHEWTAYQDVPAEEVVARMRWNQ